MNEAKETTESGAAGALGLAAEVPLHREFRHLKSSWCWFFSLGILMVAGGILALVFPMMTSVVAMLGLGITLMVAGVATIVASFWAGKWSGMLLQLLVGIVYVVVGLQITDKPVVAGAVTAIVLAGFFIVVGAFRAVAALVVRFPHWGWALLNGVITFLCGVVIYRHFPEAGLWVVGLLVGLELLFNGLTWIMLSLSIRRIPANNA